MGRKFRHFPFPRGPSKKCWTDTRRKKAQNEALYSEYWRAEDSALDSCGNLISFLKKTRGTWQIKGNTVLFANTTDVKSYNRLLDGVRAAIAAETASTQKQAASIKQTLRET